MGRRKSFDEQEVLNKAMISFWTYGYERTTARQLEKDMGINQFSIYSTFKDKSSLYKRVLENYTSQMEASFLKDFRKEDCNLMDIERFMLHFADCLEAKKVPGSCMMVASASRLEFFDAETQKVILNFFDLITQNFKQALENSKSQGLIPDHVDVKEEAEYLTGIAQSISIYSKVKTCQELKEYISTSLEKVG